MTDDKEHYNYAISQDEKNFAPHIRHNTRFITHPYSQQNIIQPLDTNVQNELNQIQLSQTRMQSFTAINHQSLIQTRDSQSIKNASNISICLKSDKNQNTQNSSAEIKAEGTETETISGEEAKIPEAIRLPENLENLPKADEFPNKRSRWNTNEEILALLLNFSKHEEWQSKDVVIRPESGSMLMYSRKKVRYRRDGYCWKKRKDGKTTREDHMKLKVQGVECIYGCYVHSAVLPTFHRRCYWLLQNPDIVLVHYLNVPYPDDSKLAALIPNIAFWTEKKEWTREELLLQLKPMYENPGLENGKDGEADESKLSRINQVSSFIESMIAQLLEKQRYVRTALANSLECGCGNRKCLGASRCTRPIRRISSAKKQGKRANVNVKLQEKRLANNNERNVLKTTPIRKLSGLKVENHSNSQTPNSTYYSPQSQHNEGEQSQSQLQQLLAQPQQTPNDNLMQTVNSKEILTNYSRTDMRIENYLSNGEFSNGENQHYQTYSCQLTADQYRPNNEMTDEKQEINLPENVSNSNLNIIPYQNEDSEYTADKYQSDTTDGSDCNSYSTIHHQASPNDSFTSVEDADAYPNGDILDDLIMNVNQCYNYENGDYNADKSLYELIIQLSQKEKKSSNTNPLLSYEKLQQYGIHSEGIDTCTPMFENDTQPVSDANGNFLNPCSRYTTAGMEENTNNLNIMPNDFARIDENQMENYSTEIDINFMNTPEFNSSERSASNQSLQDSRQNDSPCAIIDLAPEWSYCEGGTKLLIIGPWYFQTDYSVLFDSYSVPATLIQAGVLKCYCPEHAVGLVSVQVVSGGSIISNSVIFEYKKRPSFEESTCQSLCNIKSEHYNQYMYENDTLLKFILIQRIEAIQDDAFMHSSSLINKYEEVREKTTI